MKILIICNCSTGLETFRKMLISELIAENNNIVIIVPKTHDIKENEAEERIKDLGCTLEKIPMERRGLNPIKDIELMHNYHKIVCKYKPDFIITYTIKPNIYGGIVACAKNIPYAVNITGLGTAFQNENLLKYLVVKLYKYALKKAKVVFFENVENRRIFVENGIIQEEKTKVLAGAGVDLSLFEFKEYPQIDNYTRYLFIGRIMKEKGIDELFEAMKCMIANGYKCTLDIVGSFEENYSKRIHDYEEEGWLHYHGYQEDVRPFIEKCHCFVLPSWHEGMANTNLECAAMGRPVITSNIHGCKEAIVKNKTGYLCEKNNIDSLYECMEKMYNLSYEERAIMGEAGRKHMELCFDKKKVVEETIKTIDIN